MYLQVNTLLENRDWGLDGIKFKINQWLQNVFPGSYLNSFLSRIWLFSTFVAETQLVCSGGFKNLRVGEKNGMKKHDLAERLRMQGWDLRMQ